MVTLIIVLVIGVLLFLFLPFTKALLKDKRELRERPLTDRFSIFFDLINQAMMNGQGKVIPIPGDPRSVNLFAESRNNLLIQCFYSTGSLKVVLRYKFLQKEFCKEETYYNVRNIDTFGQERMANQFVTKMNMAMYAFQQGLSVPNMSTPMDSMPTDDHPLHIVPGTYRDLTVSQRCSIINLGYLMYQTPGTPAYGYPTLPVVRMQLNDLQVSWNDCERVLQTKGEEQVYEDLSNLPSGQFDMCLLFWSSVVANAADIDPERKRRFDAAMQRLGYTESDVEQQLKKIALLSQYFGLS